MIGTVSLSLFKRSIVAGALIAGGIGAGATAKAQSGNLRISAPADTLQRSAEAAITAYNVIIDMEPFNDEAFSNRCWWQAVLGRELERALADCDRVLQLNPNNIQVFDHRGLANLKLGNYGRSIADYDRLLQVRPLEASSLYGRGLAKQKSGSTGDGEADMAAAKASEPRIAELFVYLGVQ